jgi:hypothetical protein
MFCLTLLGTSAIYGYAFFLLMRERNQERRDFMKELRRKHYIDSGAAPDEAANAIIAEDLDKIVEDLAKTMPKSDTAKRYAPPDVIELPNGAKISREM